MESVIKVVLLVLLPLAWGLGVEFLFERIRRRRARSKNQPDAQPARADAPIRASGSRGQEEL